MGVGAPQDAVAGQEEAVGSVNSLDAMLRRDRKWRRREATELTRRILLRVGRDDDRRAFIVHRFHLPLEDYRARSYQAAGLHIGLNVVIAAGGLATSAIVAAGGDTTRWKVVIVIVGVLVGVLSATNQILRPGQKNGAYARAALDLRNEGWLYVSGLGDYRALAPEDPDRAYLLFAERVLRAQRDAERIAEPADPGAGGGAQEDGTT